MKAIRAKRLTIRGEPWSIILTRPPENKCDALCDYNSRTIYIRPSSKDKRGAIVHEILHACLPDYEEEAICEIEEALSRGIKTLESSSRR